MANTLGVYNPTYYAQEALIWLSKALGLGNSVHVGFDEERRAFNRGDVISIRRPSVLTVSDGGSAAQDLNTETVSLTLDKWREVRFTLSDKELAFTGPNTMDNPIIRDHIMPAAYALADDVDQKLAELVVQVPHAYGEPSGASAATIAGILKTDRALFDLKCPTKDERNMFFMIGGSEHADLAALAAFSQWQGAGPAGAATQMNNQLGQRYGYNFFRNQNRTTQAYANITDFAGAINGAVAKGVTTLVVDALGTSDVLNKGTILKFTSGAELGNQYTLTANATMSTGAGSLLITPALRVGAADNDTFAIGDLAALNQGAAGTGLQDSVTNNLNLAFHRSFAALAMARLPDFGEHANKLGANIVSVQDPVTGLAMRSRIHYLGATSKIEVVLDIVYGVKMLNPDLACRYELVNT